MTSIPLTEVISGTRPKRVRRLSPTLLVGLSGMTVLVLLAVLAPMIWGSAALQGSADLREGPSSAHWFGTDSQGRDVLLRTLVATRLTLAMGLAATAISVMLGGLVGGLLIVSGYRLRWIGGRFIDLWLALPPILVALIMTAIFGPNAVTVLVAIGIAFSPQFARLTNNLAASIGTRDFVTTSHLLGVSPIRVFFTHIVPNIASPVLVLTSVSLATSIVTMSGLSFIGLGVQQPAIDWGQLLASGLRDIYQNPSAALAPAIFIVLTGLIAALIGDGLVQLGEPRAARVRGSAQALEQIPRDGDGYPAPVSDPGGAAGRVVEVHDLRVDVAEGGDALVKGVSFFVDQGEVVGLVGESGSGKSVTAMTAARLLPPELEWAADRLSVAGHEFQPGGDVPPKFALDLGVVFQDPSSCFNPARKLGAQITETIRVHRKVGRREAERLAIEKLREARVTLPETRMRQYPHELSGGMRQRAMIAMALMTTPKMLIADEPTTALDVTVQADVLRLIKQIGAEHGMSVLLISHDIDLVAAMCDRVYVMYRGEIVEHLTVRQLRDREVSHPYTARLLEASASTALEGAAFRNSRGSGASIEEAGA